MSEKSDTKQEFVDYHIKRTLASSAPKLQDYLRVGDTVLDVGCGPGTISLDVANVISPGTLHGIDPVGLHIETAARIANERNIHNAIFHVGDGYSLDFDDATFDVVYSHTVLHYFYDPERAIREQKRVVKPGGWVIACGVRDWGLVKRYPPCPSWEKLVEARALYAKLHQHNPKPDNEHKMFGHTQAGRMCPGWFAAAGLDDLRVMVKPVRLAYSGADTMNPHPMDLLPWKEGDIAGYHSYYETECNEMIEESLIDRATVDRAMSEARDWFRDPHAFHFHIEITIAGRAK